MALVAVVGLLPGPEAVHADSSPQDLQEMTVAFTGRAVYDPGGFDGPGGSLVFSPSLGANLHDSHCAGQGNGVFGASLRGENFGRCSLAFQGVMRSSLPLSLDKPTWCTNSRGSGLLDVSVGAFMLEGVQLEWVQSGGKTWPVTLSHDGEVVGTGAIQAHSLDALSWLCTWDQAYEFFVAGSLQIVLADS